MSGVFIAFVGMPGAGKTAVCEALATLIGGVALMEPTEWPPIVTDPATAGGFSALTWFRAMRVSMYYRAVREREQGRVAVLDTYYDKICRELLGAEGMEWFLSTADPYFDLYQEIAARDWGLLPTADAIVTFQLTEPVWRHFLGRRNRTLDEDWGVSRAFQIQSHFVAAAAQLGNEFRVPVLVFNQEIASPEAAATRLLMRLQQEEVL